MERDGSKNQELKIDYDPVNEQVVLAAAIADDVTRTKLTSALMPDHFQDKRHRAAWAALKELVRRGMSFDVATLQKLGKDVDATYLTMLAETRPDVPTNLSFHLEMLLWDHARIETVRGPLASLLQDLRDPQADPERVKSVARQVQESLATYREHTFLRDPETLIAERITEIRARREGTACYRYGLDGLDFFEDKKTRRMLPGPAPGQVTLVVGVPGGGKSTATARITLGLARQKRRVLYCAWEMNGGTSLELMACMSLGWSRTKLQEGKSSKVETAHLSEEELEQLRARMEAISKFVRVLENPFQRRRSERPSNDRNLDILHGYVAESGADVVVCDLWKRCLRFTKPDDEEQALMRQQAMAEETKAHFILVHQLRLKDVEDRQDKHPTREAIKGSGAWTEVPDTIIGVHRPGLWKGIDDNVIELDILKQRYGKWPLAVECDWDGDKGSITGGRSISYDAFSASREDESGVNSFFGNKKGRR
jgi:replicative DNA helicase